MVSRIACLNLPEFPLQILLRAHPQWCGLPAAVVDRDAAQGTILWSNERARANRVLPGLRYAAALSLVPDLRAGEISPGDVAAAVAALTDALRFYTPDVEPSASEPGVFWLGASGLSLLYPSLLKWASLVQIETARTGFEASIVLGYSRFATYALAKASGRPRVEVSECDAAERARAGKVPLSCLRMDSGARDALAKLGITTLGGFLSLPGNGIRQRFGEDAHHLYRIARGELTAPLQPAIPREPARAAIHLDEPEESLDRLMAVIDREVQSLARRLDDRGEVLTAVAVQLEFDTGTKTAERLQPASPTLDISQVTELLQLRLAGTLAAHADARGVTTIRIELEGAAASHTQGDFFTERPARDTAAAARAMARVRAELGDDAVVKAVLRDGHLPEARFAWQPVTTVAMPQPRAVKSPPLVRRIFAKPVPFSPGRSREASAELIRHIDEGTVRETFGPYIVSGGWWTREVQREYYFVRTAAGRSLWMFYDRRRMGWFIHGEVE
ncbi:MAG TPA: DNA polymerase Y family protein [Candidatus Krumholzibacteria bacterium]|nr:DNA polymerase Y family protein [Candidatus Krumholzibacteria bacterium]